MYELVVVAVCIAVETVAVCITVGTAGV